MKMQVRLLPCGPILHKYKMEDIVGRQVINSSHATQAGDFYWLSNQDDVPYQGLGYICPCGCNDKRAVNIGGSGWNWNGNVEKPTLTPSIFHSTFDGKVPDNCGWHGFLTDGIWKTC